MGSLINRFSPARSKLFKNCERFSKIFLNFFEVFQDFRDFAIFSRFEMIFEDYGENLPRSTIWAYL